MIFAEIALLAERALHETEIGADAVPVTVATAVTMIGAEAGVVDAEVGVEVEEEADDNSIPRLSMVLLFPCSYFKAMALGSKG